MKVSRVFILFFCLLSIVGLTLFVSNSNADIIYSTGLNGTALVTIDTETGIGTVIGPTGVPDTFGAAFDGTGALYTVTSTGFMEPGTDSYLGTFDLGTGLVTPIGEPLGVSYMMALEFAPDGTLYGGTFNFSINGLPEIPYAPDGLWTIDTSTGIPTYMGDFGFAWVMDFAVDSSGTMWAVAVDPYDWTCNLYTIDLWSGEGTYVTTITGTIYNFVMGIMFDSNDVLYATEYDSDWINGSPLYTVDTATGEATLIAYTGIDSLHGGDIECPYPCGTIDNDGDGYDSSVDCDDDNHNIYPGAPEMCNGMDDNCNGIADEGLTTDADGDGYSTPGSCHGSRNDCDDSDGSVNPGAAEVCNGIDDNCNGQVDEGDRDNDGVDDCVDSCPDEDASGFDADGDGCLDSLDELSETIEVLTAEGVIDEQLENSLVKKVESATKSVDKDNICAAINKLEALKNETNAQRGKKITDEGADAVIAYADSVIAYLLSQLPAGDTCP